MRISMKKKRNHLAHNKDKCFLSPFDILSMSNNEKTLLVMILHTSSTDQTCVPAMPHFDIRHASEIYVDS